MKTLTTIKTKLSIMILLFVVNAVAQNSSDAVNTYRVTAYQKNNNVNRFAGCRRSPVPFCVSCSNFF